MTGGMSQVRRRCLLVVGHKYKYGTLSKFLLSIWSRISPDSLDRGGLHKTRTGAGRHLMQLKSNARSRLRHQSFFDEHERPHARARQPSFHTPTHFEDVGLLGHSLVPRIASS